MNYRQGYITVDDLAQKFLEPDIEKSIPEVELNMEEVSIGLEVENIRMHFDAKQISLATFLVGLLTLIANIGFYLLLILK